MSGKSNQIVAIWKVVEEYLQRNFSQVKNNGNDLTASQVEILHDAISLLVLAWLDMLSDLDGYSDRWIEPWLNTLVKTDLSKTVSLLKAADQLLLDSVQSDVRDYDDFKHRLSVDYPFAGAMIAPVKKRLVRWLSFSDPASFSAAHECFVFITRLNLPGLTGLKESARESYFANEKKLAEWTEFTSEEASVIKSWFPLECSCYLYDNWHPKHGPGAVADLMGSHVDDDDDDFSYLKRPSTWTIDKYQLLGKDQKLRYLDLRLGRKSGIPWTCEPLKARVAKVVFVPKSIDKLRTICAEPAVLQWYQQGFLTSLLSYIDEAPQIKTMRGVYQCTLARRISLKHQEYSRDLACLGSIDGSLSTIDLSSASDSVSWRMVWKWISGSALATLALTTRSNQWQIGKKGKRFKNEKFAPMGSALCFPFECIIFCAIIECAIADCGGRVSDSCYRVYGDDIIIETKYVRAVMNRLIKNGFLVNKRKSFYDRGTHNFREACGGEYLDGVSVKPVRLSRKFAGFRDLNTNTASRIADLIDLCNTSYDTLPSVRRRLVIALNGLEPSLRPRFRSPEFRPSIPLTDSQLALKVKVSRYFLSYVTDHEVEAKWIPVQGESIASYSTSNFHLKTWSNETTKKLVYGGLRTVCRTPVGFEYEDIRYYEWLRLAENRDRVSEFYETPLESVIDLPGETKWRTKRTPGGLLLL